MTAQPAEQPSAALIAAGGVFIPGHLAEPIWRVLWAECIRRQRDGGQVRPDVAQALDVLRAAAQAHMSAHGHDPRTPADIEPPSTPDLLTTAQLAGQLGVSERHARRLAHHEGIKPVTRNAWACEDVAALAARKAA